MQRALAALGHPERGLPPVVHVAGTNGKGSSLRLSPRDRRGRGPARPRLHLAAPRPLPRAHPPRRHARRGGDADPSLAEVEERNAGAPITVFEITTAAAFLAVQPRSRRPAGAGGRPRRPLRRDQCGRPAGGDGHHLHLHGPHGVPRRHARQDRLREGRHHQARRALRRRRRRAPRRAATSAPRRPARHCSPRGRDWRIERQATAGLRYADAAGTLDLPPPSLAGPHQIGQRRHRHRRAPGLEPALAERGSDRHRLGRGGMAGADAAPARPPRRRAAPGLGTLARRRPQPGRRPAPSPRISASGAKRRPSGRSTSSSA